MPYPIQRLLMSLMLIIAAPALTAGEPVVGEANLFVNAAARIEKYRKADAFIRVVDAAGRPVAGVQVAAEQTRHAFLFGCNLFQFGRFQDAREEAIYRQRFSALCNYATLPFYWPTYEPQRGATQHARVEAMADWCQQHAIATKGHPLAWNYADPSWLPDDPDEVWRLQLDRITDCVTRMKGRIDCWDVVNEATHFERDNLRQRAPKMTRMWEKVGRIELVDACFRRARTANPGATLLINDYRVDPAYVQLIEQWTARAGRQPFDVIGIQSHMHGGVWSHAKIWEVCQRFARFGVPLHFTETTVLSGKLGWKAAEAGQSWPSTPEGERRQAEDVARFYTMLFSHPAVTAITWWDLSDRNAWQRAPAGLLRRDLSPKPAYDRLLDLVKKQWWTRVELQTDAEGHARFRGFLGDYLLRVRDAKGREVEVSATLRKGSVNAIRMPLGD
jgi:endo-1,4-beta-xylanase